VLLPEFLRTFTEPPSIDPDQNLRKGSTR